MTKIYTAVEALQALLDKKILKATEGLWKNNYYRFTNEGGMQYTKNRCGDWERSFIHVEDLIDGEFEVIEKDPLTDGQLVFREISKHPSREWLAVNISNRKALTKGSNLFLDSLEKALNTLLRFRFHPLAKKAVEGNQQYGFDGVENDGELIESRWGCVINKEGSFSAWFASKKDREIAVNDIGRDNIKEMFETLSNIGG